MVAKNTLFYGKYRICVKISDAASRNPPMISMGMVFYNHIEEKFTEICESKITFIY